MPMIDSRPNDTNYLFPPDQLVCYLIRGIIIDTNGLKLSINLFYSCYEHSSLLKTIAHHELGLHLINKIISNVIGNLFLGTLNTPHLEL